jgi:hypothetical protein
MKVKGKEILKNSLQIKHCKAQKTTNRQSNMDQKEQSWSYHNT